MDVPHCVQPTRAKLLKEGVNPDEVVAMGAAIQGGVLRGDVKVGCQNQKSDDVSSGQLDGGGSDGPGPE